MTSRSAARSGRTGTGKPSSAVQAYLAETREMGLSLLLATAVQVARLLKKKSDDQDHA